MELLQGTFLFLSMCSLCYSQENQDPTTTPKMSQSLGTVTTTTSPSTATSGAVKIAVNTSEKLSTPVTTESVKTSPVGALSSSSVFSPYTGTLKEPSSMPTISTKSSFVSTVAKTERGTSQTERPSNASKTTSLQSSDHQFQSTVSTTQSSNKSNHILTSPSPTKMSGRPSSSAWDANASFTEIANTLEMITTPYIKNQENSKDSGNTSSLLTNPSYSSVILPVVIALIAITLSVFTLVGLYRMCWKTDPGTPDNGTDQPQSDKESVKLLTVKTISPETSEQSAQGKNKN